MVALQRQQGNRPAIVADKFHFKSRPVIMHEDSGAYVAPCQPVFRQITR